MSASNIDWTDETPALGTMFKSQAGLKKRQLGAGPRAQELFQRTIAFGTIAGAAGRDDVPRLCRAAFGNGLDVIPARSASITVCALAVGIFEERGLSLNRDRRHAALAAVSVLTTLETICRVASIAFTIARRSVLQTPRVLNTSKRQPRQARAAARRGGAAGVGVRRVPLPLVRAVARRAAEVEGEGVNHREYKRLTLEQMQARRWRTARELESGMQCVPAGTEVEIVGKQGGLIIRGAPCKCCGVAVKMRKVAPSDLSEVAS